VERDLRELGVSDVAIVHKGSQSAARREFQSTPCLRRLIKWSTDSELDLHSQARVRVGPQPHGRHRQHPDLVDAGMRSSPPTASRSQASSPRKTTATACDHRAATEMLAIELSAVVCLTRPRGLPRPPGLSRQPLSWPNGARPRGSSSGRGALPVTMPDHGYLSSGGSCNNSTSRTLAGSLVSPHSCRGPHRRTRYHCPVRGRTPTWAPGDTGEEGM